MNTKNSKGIVAATAIAMGLINGLFGAGGGMLAVVVLERIQKLESQRAHATALIIMLPLSIISIIVYLLRGLLTFEHLFAVILGMLPGSFLGARLLGKLKSVWIDRLFCVLMLAAGIRMVL